MTAKQALQYVELDLDYCSLTYGTAPCTAALGVTGPIKCFNTIATCQDSTHFTNGPVTLRFGEASDYRPLDIEAIPSIQSVAFSPALIRPGEDLGQRATLRVTLKDHPHSDTGPGFDKYLADRTYDPYSQGSFWGKFRARQPYLRGRAIRWYQGFADQALDEMELRYFIVESFDGPKVDGTYTLVAIDPLKLLDGDRAQAPVASNGRLNADILAAAISATLTPAGIGDSDYAASGYLALGGSEVAGFTRAADALTLVRGQLNTTAADHKAADRVQGILRYDSMDPADIIFDLMTTYAGVPASYIPLTEWQAETAAFLRREYTGSIAEPTPVAQLVAELMQQAGLAIWWDDLAGQIRLRVLRGLTASSVLFDDSNIIEGTFARKEQPDKRISLVVTYFDQKSPLEEQDQVKNYRGIDATDDLVNETNYGSAAIRKIYSRWIPQGARTAADRVNDLFLGRYGTPPRQFTFSLMRGAQADPILGSLYNLQWRTEQDATGALETVSAQIIQLTPTKDRFILVAEELIFTSLDSEDLDNRQITLEADAQNINLRTLHDAQYPDPVSGDEVTFIIEADVVVGSASTSLPSIDTGTWPAGVTLNLIVYGRIQGCGAAGGTGANGSGDVDGTAGGTGGTALRVQAPINLTDATGALWGGGGGGGGGPCRDSNDHRGGGGGGGSGYSGGTGGTGPGNGREGSDGTRTAGGSGGHGWTNSNFFAGPSDDPIRKGGDGGAPGTAGQAGQGHSDVNGGSGGAPGKAIDGIANVTTIGSPGDRRGPQT